MGFAFSAPAWSALVPEVVTKDELASAVTLGGLQFNLCGIIGPAAAAVILSQFGANLVFAMNAAGFLLVIAALAQWKRAEKQSKASLENFIESFASAIRYVRYAPGIQVVLARNVLFALFISVIPALLPVIGLKKVLMNSSDLGLLFTSMGVGSVLGAIVLIPRARARFSPNTLTILASVLLAVVFVLMAVVRQTPLFMGVAGLAGHRMDNGRIRTLGGRPAGDATLGAWAYECDPYHAFARRDGARRTRLGRFCRLAWCDFHADGGGGSAFVELGAGISAFDRFYGKAELRPCYAGDSIPRDAPRAAPGRWAGSDHDGFSNRCRKSYEIPSADA